MKEQVPVASAIVLPRILGLFYGLPSERFFLT